MCIVSNWVNEAQDFMAVTKYDDLPNSLIPVHLLNLEIVHGGQSRNAGD